MNEIYMALGGLIGLALLYYGAEYLVRGGGAIASRSCVSPLVIGLTLVAFGTSAPELFVSTSAALHGLGDICIGNVVGSNICNIALILGLSALIAPLAVNADLFKRDLPIMILASVVLTVVCLFCGGIGRVVGLLFTIGIIAYTIVGVRSSSEKCGTETVPPREDAPLGGGISTGEAAAKRSLECCARSYAPSVASRRRRALAGCAKGVRAASPRLFYAYNTRPLREGRFPVCRIQSDRRMVRMISH